MFAHWHVHSRNLRSHTLKRQIEVLGKMKMSDICDLNSEESAGELYNVERSQAGRLGFWATVILPFPNHNHLTF